MACISAELQFRLSQLSPILAGTHVAGEGCFYSYSWSLLGITPWVMSCLYSKSGEASENGRTGSLSLFLIPLCDLCYFNSELELN